MLVVFRRAGDYQRILLSDDVPAAPIRLMAWLVHRRDQVAVDDLAIDEELLIPSLDAPKLFLIRAMSTNISAAEGTNSCRFAGKQDDRLKWRG